MSGHLIAFDAKRAAQNRTGLGNYSRFVVHLLSKYAHDNDYLLFAPNPSRASALAELPQEVVYEVATPESFFGRKLPALWRTCSISRELRRRKVALYHGLSNELPLGIHKTGCRSVVTIHDVIFLHQPDYYKPIDRWIYRLKFRYAGLHADRVITVSEFSKREIVRLLGIPAEKIDVVYQGIYLDFDGVATADVERVRAAYGLPSRYILYVGTIEERKNMMLVARAMKRLADQGRLPDDMKLVLVGRKTPYAEVLRNYLAAAGLAERVSMVHDVTFADLPSVYRGAEYLVYPSRIEGFGIPMLEAAAAGIPAIGCTGSSLEEAGGSGAFYVGPDDDEAMADCMLRLWTDEALKKERSAMGRAHAERFSDRCLFDSLKEVYEKVLGCKL